MTGIQVVSSSSHFNLAQIAGVVPIISAAGRLAIDLFISGVAPTMDDATKIAMSVYGRDAAAGDTPIQVTAAGHVLVAGGGTFTPADSQANTGISPRDESGGTRLGVTQFAYLFNEVTWDRPRSNIEVTVLANDLTTTATRTSADFSNFNGRTLMVSLVTANLVGSTATYTLSLEWKFDGTNYTAIWTAAAAVTTATNAVYVFGTGAADAQNIESVEMIIPRTFRYVLTVATADGSNSLDTAVFHAIGL